MISAIQIDDGRLQQQLDKLRRQLGDAVERGLRRATELLRAAVSALAASPTGVPAASPLGELAASVRSEVVDERGNASGHIFLAPPADQYGLFVEVGSRPHFPPPAALEGWVRRRLGITGEREAREIAFLIGRKISRLGTPGRLIFERALEQNKDRVIGIFEEEIAKALN